MSTDELFRQRMQRLMRTGHDGQHDWHVYQWLSHRWQRKTIVEEIMLLALLPLTIILVLRQIRIIIRAKIRAARVRVSGTTRG